MSETKDNLIFNWSNKNAMSVPASKPYLKKELVHLIDQNGSSDYSRNQSVIETVSICNGGGWVDYKEGFLAFPVVVSLTSTVDLPATDPLIDFKSSNVNFIDSISVEYNGDNVVQQNPNISPYFVFKQHSTYSSEDLLLNSHTGYRFDKSSKWNYDALAGMTSSYTNADFETFVAEKNANLLSKENIKAKNENYFERVGNNKTHIYYYTAYIRLKDLLFFEKMPLVRGVNVKIIINFNQFDLTLQHIEADEDADPVVVEQIKVLSSSFKGTYCPLLRLSKVADGVTETISLKIGKNGEYTHPNLNQCRLYVPIYTMNEDVKKSYMSQQKKILYEDVYMRHFKNVTQSFQYLLTNSMARMQRLVIVPTLSKNKSGGLNNNGELKLTPAESPYALEPSTCSPYYMVDFQVKLNGQNLYSQNQQYGFESYLNEMNGTWGVNSNLEPGLTSSLISLKDYNSNYGYIVCDLSRRMDFDEYLQQNIEISGNVKSGKELDFLVFITYSKDITIDLTTGEILKKI